MTQKTRTAFKADKNTAFADNSAGDISAADLRGEMDHIADSALFPEDTLPSHSHAAGDTTSGAFADARISESSVTQHAAAVIAAQGVEANATADQTGAEIKAAYEGEADTNAFDDAAQTKLAGIEAAADVTDATNVAAAGAAMAATLASTANGDGAALIGVEDSGALLAATNVEDALAELAGAAASGGDAWGDVVDADIIPDANNTRDLGSDAARFAEVHTQSLSVAGSPVASVADPAGDAIPFFDLSAGTVAYFGTLTGLTISGTTLSADVQSVAGLTGAISASGLRTALNVEDNADVTDEANVTAALDGATLTDVGTPAGTDRILLQDASDSNNLKYADFSEFAGGGGGMTSFDVGADTGTAETVGDSNTLTLTGGAGIDTSVAATDTVTFAIDSTVATLTGTQTLTNKDISGASNTYRAASLTATGAVELATVAEVDTGTDATRAITPDGLAGSVYGEEHVIVCLFDDSEDVATGDGAGDQLFRVPSKCDGWDIVDVGAYVQTAGTTGTTDIQIHNVTDTVDVLSTVITIDSAETDSSTAAAAPVINAANDSVAGGDKLRFDVDAVSTTAPQGLWVYFTMRAP